MTHETRRCRLKLRNWWIGWIPAGRLRDICPLYDAAEKTLEMAVSRLALSASARDRMLKVSRTIADLGGSEQGQVKQMGQAHRRSDAVPVAR